MKRIWFYANSTKPVAVSELQRLTVAALGIGLDLDDSAPEAVVVLGGDGTMLSAVHRFPGVPLLGLNLGSLGYLAGVERPFFEAALKALRSGDFTVSRRTALKVGGQVALNDVVVSKSVSGHAAVIELTIDGRFTTRFFADGLVVATPTGSTAYSLSAGGPILLPDSQSIVITPICPHALTSRPLVVRDTVRIGVRVRPRPGAESLEAFADGAPAGHLAEGDLLEIEKAAEGVPLIELSGYDPCDVLNRKLGWSGSSIG